MKPKTEYKAIVFDPPLVDRVGDISDVLAEFLDTQTHEISMQLQQQHPTVAKKVLTNLLNEFATLEGTKLPLHRKDIQLPNISEEQIDFCLNQLQQARILRVEEDTYELSHDTLAKRIAEKRDVDEIAILEAVNLINERYQAYENTDTLLSTNELQLINIHEKRLKQENRLSHLHWGYLKRSRRYHRRRQLIRALTVAGTMLILAIFSLYAYRAKGAAEQAKTIALQEEQKAKEALENYKKAQAEIAAAQRAAAKQSYNEAIARGEVQRAVSEYDLAIIEYEKALVALQGYEDDVPNGVTTADSLIKESKRMLSLKSTFEEWMEKGETHLATGASQFIDALESYKRARALGYNNILAQSAIDKVSGKLEGAYERLKKNGEIFFAAQGYDFAKEQFEQALRIKPNDAYLIQKIKACQHELQ